MKELLEKCRESFEERKNDSEKRRKFLKDAGIFDENNQLNPKFFPQTLSSSDQKDDDVIAE